MRCTWHRPVKGLWQPMSSSSTVTNSNFQTLATAWKRIRTALQLLGLPSAALAAHSNDQPDRIDLRNSPFTHSPNKRHGLSHRDLDHGLQAGLASPQTLAPTPRLPDHS